MHLQRPRKRFHTFPDTVSYDEYQDAPEPQVPRDRINKILFIEFAVLAEE
jgi:hypothetical protein